MTLPDPAQKFFVIGRLRGITPRRLGALVRSSGHALTRSMKAATAVVVAHSVAAKCIGLREPVAPLDSLQDKLVSERSFRALLGFSEPWVTGPYQEADLIRVSGLDAVAVRSLALLDLFEGRRDAYTFTDLGTSKRVARWLAEGYELGELIPVVHQALRRSDPIGAIQLARIGRLRIGSIFAGALQDLDGQLLLPIDAREPDLEHVFGQAFEAEAAGAFEEAARLYEQALQLDPSDAVIHFNFGNVLSELGLTARAEIAYRKALVLEPAFSEAWFNIGVLAEGRSQSDRAKTAYRHAVVSDTFNYAAKFNLARLLTSERAYLECIPLWDELAKEGDAGSRLEARRWATLCRLQSALTSRRSRHEGIGKDEADSLEFGAIPRQR